MVEQGGCGFVMRAAVLSIATGKYVDFLANWKRTIRANLLPGVQICMFVFTDAALQPEADFVPLAVTHLPWPLTTLFKFRYFRSIAPQLAAFDLVIHIDMDMYVAAPVHESDLLGDGRPLFGVRHPFWQGQPRDFLETNPASLAYLPAWQRRGMQYCQGCLWGGRTVQVIQLLEACDTAVEADLRRNVIAKWHDESHLNRYFQANRHSVHTLSPSFAYPEGYGAPYEARIVHIAKDDRAYQGTEPAHPRFRWLGPLREPVRRARRWVSRSR